MNAATQKETLGFQAEVQRLLHLMIHALYSNKEIFLRELISNASDACDKLRFGINSGHLKPALSTTNANDFTIRLRADKAARTLSIEDNGIGMSREEAIQHLGTIAKSGTRDFIAQLSGDQAKDAQLIGQFGVGFYSAFIVAERVTVESRRADAPADSAVRWESDGSGEFSVETIEKDQIGTCLTLHLREGEDEWLSSWKLREVVKRYSDHIAFPIQIQQESWDAEKQTMEVKDEWETINQANALWTRSKSELSAEDYERFFESLSFGNGKPLKWAHHRVEGRSEYTQLLYLPRQAPHDLWDRNQKRGLKLYVRRVFIMEDAEQLLPAYLRFVQGVVDSSDLPLNVSRELLQESRDVKAIREGCTKRVLSMLEELAESENDQDQNDYALFWREFGNTLKEGVAEDFANQERLAKLLRFASTQQDSSEQTVSLAAYVARMKPEQEHIYYLTAESYAAALASPHLEIFRKKGIEVLLLTDRVDEWMLSYLSSFAEKSLQSIAKGSANLDKLADDTEKQAQATATEAHKPFIERLQQALQEQIKSVQVSARLVESPVCIVAEEGAMSLHLQRMLKAAGQQAPVSKPILEINLEHPLIQRVRALPDEATDFQDWAALLLDQAILAEGGQPQDPAAFVKRLNKLLIAA
ncbi:molecular chaperone HtpG [Parvibium lacunae]|uniref:Chaperone protein HtpG n=1 Tax=Parvibium lacunae TaxID=1888893 RepID=A0A368L555_9BURK|nr:molecular chaperone HtpG [Parvibium lacunae]RCS58280.1 molecular chaperone HtpG [Parvibium lacunae]